MIDMYKNIIFPIQAEDLLKKNFEGLGELDKREYLRDTSILIKLAEKGLKSEQEIAKHYLDKIRDEIEQLRNFRAQNYDLERYCDNFDARIIFRDNVLQIIDKYKAESEG